MLPLVLLQKPLFTAQSPGLHILSRVETAMGLTAATVFSDKLSSCQCICISISVYIYRYIHTYINYIYKDSRGLSFFRSCARPNLSMNAARNRRKLYPQKQVLKSQEPLSCLFRTLALYTPRKTRPNPRLTLPKVYQGHHRVRPNPETAGDLHPLVKHSRVSFFALFQRPLYCEDFFVSSSFGIIPGISHTRITIPGLI